MLCIGDSSPHLTIPGVAHPFVLFLICTFPLVSSDLPSPRGGTGTHFSHCQDRGYPTYAMFSLYNNGNQRQQQPLTLLSLPQNQWRIPHHMRLCSRSSTFQVEPQHSCHLGPPNGGRMAWRWPASQNEHSPTHVDGSLQLQHEQAEPQARCTKQHI